MGLVASIDTFIAKPTPLLKRQIETSCALLLAMLATQLIDGFQITSLPGVAIPGFL
jgi:hypothetical protein